MSLHLPLTHLHSCVPNPYPNSIPPIPVHPALTPAFPQMKMPSKKLAHIPVYALGFESLPGSLLPKAPPLRRREPFQ